MWILPQVLVDVHGCSMYFGWILFYYMLLFIYIYLKITWDNYTSYQTKTLGIRMQQIGSKIHGEYHRMILRSIKTKRYLARNRLPQKLMMENTIVPITSGKYCGYTLLVYIYISHIQTQQNIGLLVIYPTISHKISPYTAISAYTDHINKWGLVFSGNDVV